MNKTNTMLIRRAAWYTFGLLLFFAPFAYYSKVLAWFFQKDPGNGFHATCLRMPVLNLFTGKWSQILPSAMITLGLLLVSAFIFGAFFCGRLCVAGALPEYLSRLVPDRFKIDWTKYVNPVPIRYGFLASYLILPFTAGSIACSFCNFSFMQRLLDGGFWGNFGVMGSTAIITFFLWFILFGILTKGGRGYCNFVCPVGAVQNLVHSVGSRFGFAYKLHFAPEKCTSCSVCVKNCPMGSLKIKPDGLSHQIHNCITCRQCESSCPTAAISYGKGQSDWNNAAKKHTLLSLEKEVTEVAK